jgi:hypothetical protein
MLTESNVFILFSYSQQYFHRYSVSVLTTLVRRYATPVRSVYVQKPILAVLSSFILFVDLLLFPRTYTYVVYSFFSEKLVIMSESLPTQFYERRKKSRRDVDVSEGGSSNPPPQRQSKRIVHRDYPRDHMHIEIEIE